jgi:hypothetical protein
MTGISEYVKLGTPEELARVKDVMHAVNVHLNAQGIDTDTRFNALIKLAVGEAVLGEATKESVIAFVSTVYDEAYMEIQGRLGRVV